MNKNQLRPTQSTHPNCHLLLQQPQLILLAALGSSNSLKLTPQAANQLQQRVSLPAHDLAS
jgi:hypothetical protein